MAFSLETLLQHLEVPMLPSRVDVSACEIDISRGRGNGCERSSLQNNGWVLGRDSLVQHLVRGATELRSLFFRSQSGVQCLASYEKKSSIHKFLDLLKTLVRPRTESVSPSPMPELHSIRQARRCPRRPVKMDIRSRRPRWTWLHGLSFCGELTNFPKSTLATGGSICGPRRKYYVDVYPLPRNEHEFKSVAYSICRALELLQNEGLVHYDVRWANVAYDHATGSWFLLDLEAVCESGQNPKANDDNMVDELGTYTDESDLYQLGESVVVVERGSM
ncbi:hypothetical protein SELMODRAFT_409930 [Selaginella moellendorffii]|uniref:Fungal-type protein kinase domain-containing protein n=1 Tax=Selaginella moellendorffii TaxID=88036 RepID=D8RCX5_SELML|nr:hypothetical protein SELMODRAFT_409930 [Selaginella moellendorffii]